MAQLPLPSKKTIDVLAFVDAATIDPMRLDHGYCLTAESAAGNKPYALLRDAMLLPVKFFCSVSCMPFLNSVACAPHSAQGSKPVSRTALRDARS